MVIIEILSPLPLTRREDGQAIFDLWQAHLPELLPDYFSNWEPIDSEFDQHKLEAVLDRWKWPFLATKKRPAVDASIWMRKGARQQLHATLIFKIEANSVPQERLLNFLKAASVRLKADFAFIHLLTKTELERGRSNKTVTALDKQGKKLSFFLASKEMQQSIPDLYWATIFGVPYLEMFGREQILSAPAYSTELLSNEAILLQMTENLADIEDSPAVFDDVRSRVKSWLGLDAFFDMSKEASNSVRAPVFKFFDAVV